MTGSWRPILLVFAVALLVRLVVVGMFLEIYDRYETAIEGRPTVHAMVKSDAGKFYREAVGILDHYREGGVWAVQMADGPFLHGRLIALYGTATGLVRYVSERVVPTGVVGGFFLLQALVLALAIAAFYAACRRALPGGVALTAALFLALEPTSAQYAGALFSEGLYFALLPLAVAGFIVLLMRPSATVPSWLGFGLLLGLLYLQRPISILLPAAFVLAALVALRGRPTRQTLLAIAGLIVGYGVVLGALGFHNQAATGRFAVMPGQASNDPMQYIAPRVRALAQDPGLAVWNLNDGPAVEIVGAELRERAMAAARTSDGQGIDIERFNAVALEIALEIFAEHPLATVEVIGWHVFRATGHINPFQLYFFYDQIYKPRDPELDRRQIDKRYEYLSWIAAYSALILLPVLAGWFIITRALWRGRRPGAAPSPMPAWLHVLLTMMILYYPAIGGWLGNDRYILPNIVPYSVYWAVALSALLERVRSPRSAAPRPRP